MFSFLRRQSRIIRRAVSSSLGGLGGVFRLILGRGQLWFGSGYTFQGGAEKLPAFASIVHQIANTLAQLKLELRDPDEEVLPEDAERYLFAFNKGREDLSSFDFWYAVVRCMLVCGESFVEVVRTKTGIELHMIDNNNIEVFAMQDEVMPHRKYLGYRLNNGVELDKENILHFKNSSTDGFRGRSCFDRVGSMVERHIKVEELLVRITGRQPFGLIKQTNVGTASMNKAQQEELMTSMNKDLFTEQNRNTVTLPAGADYIPLQSQLKDIAYQTLVKEQFEETCRVMNVPSEIFTGSESPINNEGETRKFLAQCLQPLAVSITKTLNCVLLNYTANAHFRFALEDYVVVSKATQVTTSIQNVNAGIVSRNEARKELGLPPSEDALADQLMVPAGMSTPSTSEQFMQNKGNQENVNIELPTKLD